MRSVLEWAASLDEPREATNNLPTCPYAQRAFDQGRVAIVFQTRFTGERDIARLIDGWSDLFDVVLLVVDRTSLSASEAHALADRISERVSGADIVVMADHPDDPFIVGGQNNSNGEYLIFFIQRRAKLLQASQALKAAGYYKNWP
ncbi:MAG TPA: hypothetical protein VKT24_07680 [Rhizomicrobium sp.]|nr:hypothetical protein [Rhizomicrobium sp.]